ncbi:MAG TPA: hypothetical protein VGQ65_11670 [Thermoanaerobaculia bacterium]|jgi:hypothetical protein|nr:hypothetical protein [Thermoanaerobaculia bacterium]
MDILGQMNGTSAADQRAANGSAGRQTPRTQRGSDPRNSALSPRDIGALRFVGQAGELAQYQLHEQVFGDVSGVVVSRFVQRAMKRDLIATTRWRGIGINRLRLTARGRSYLLQHGVTADELFVLRNPIAEGHIEHQLWIVDTLVILGRAARKPDLLQPAWALQRRFTPRPVAIPDVLASFVKPPEQPALLLGVEIDRGSENLASIFLPKLEKLCEVLSSWAGGAACAIVVLTNSVRRRDSLQTRAGALPLPVIIELLPQVPGRPGLAELATTFSFIE